MRPALSIGTAECSGRHPTRGVIELVYHKMRNGQP